MYTEIIHFMSMQELMEALAKALCVWLVWGIGLSLAYAKVVGK